MNNHRLLKLACAITLENYDLASRSNPRDQKYIIRDASLLVILFIWQIILWTMVVGVVVENRVASFGIALLIAAILLKLDQAIGASIWQPGGFLSEESGLEKGVQTIKRVLPRILITVPISFATSVALMLVIFSGSIQQKLQVERTAKNEPVLKEYERREHELANQLLQPRINQVETAQRQVDDLQAAIRKERRHLESLRTRRDQLKLEADCELSGKKPGCVKESYIPRDGPVRQELLRQATVEAEKILRAEAAIQDMHAQMKTLRTNLEVAQSNLKGGREVFGDQLNELKRQKADDPRILQSKDDFLLRYQALVRLKSDPEMGDSARQLSWLTLAILMAIELAYVSVRLFFPPSSVYVLRVCEAARVEARGVRAEFYPRNHDFGARLAVVPRNNEPREGQR